MILHKPRSLGVTVLAMAFLLESCHFGPNPPNTPNSVPLTLYKSLITAQSALTSLRAQANLDFLVQHKAEINEAIQSYNTAEAAFATFDQAGAGGDASAVSNAVAILTAQVAKLVITFTQPLNAAKAAEMRGRFQAHTTAGQRIDLPTLLSYLQIAAQVAEAIPGAAPFAALAQVVLQAVQGAIAANQAASSIDLSQLHTIPLLT